MPATSQVDQVLRDSLKSQMEINATGASVIPRATILGASLLPVEIFPDGSEEKKWAYIINCLTNLFYLAVVVLGKNRFQTIADPKKNLHFQMCLSVMKDGIKDVVKIPRRHYKTTVFSECYPIWRALPFGDKEQQKFSSIGFSDLFIEWMRRAHSQDIRVLIASEVIRNAVKIGTRINHHYRNNSFFKYLWPEILPTASETWTNESMHQRRTEKGSFQGEGTFDLIGVGGALQSRHYNLVIQDDLPGLEAAQSDVVMQKTIEYHQLLVGAADDSDEQNAGRDFDELVVGNDWSFKDLNAWIAENEKYFTITSHSALGGCCNAHTFGTPIFPERFNKDILLRWKKRLGSYHFSCQFLNAPLDPSKAKFRLGDFRYFDFIKVFGQLVPLRLGVVGKVKEENGISKLPEQYRIAIRHHVADGDVIKDIFPRSIPRYMIVDPNHSGSGGRCRHAIVVVGVSDTPRRLYLYDQWAKMCPIGTFIEEIFKKAIKWKMDAIHVEAVGAQKYLLYHLETYIKEKQFENPELSNFRIVPLKTPNHQGAKAERIDNLVPIAERHEIWLNNANCEDFKEEAEAYGQKKGMIDLLDIFGYITQLAKFDSSTEEEVNEFLQTRYDRYRASVGA